MSLRNGKRAALTHVQTIIFYLFTQGLTTKAIAEKLGLCEQDVEDELRLAGAKLGLLDRFELMAAAYGADGRWAEKSEISQFQGKS